ncbi:hypothetical protein AB5I41_20710 [Sphingomonas sp. MMS24-JH45]
MDGHDGNEGGRARRGVCAAGRAGRGAAVDADGADRAERCEAGAAERRRCRRRAEEIARDAAGDLKDARFYNKPGATRAQYNADWQQCRLIARGSKTPSGSTPFFYNPAVISPLAAGIGGSIAGIHRRQDQGRPVAPRQSPPA